MGRLNVHACVHVIGANFTSFFFTAPVAIQVSLCCRATVVFCIVVSVMRGLFVVVKVFRRVATHVFVLALWLAAFSAPKFHDRWRKALLVTNKQTQQYFSQFTVACIAMMASTFGHMCIYIYIYT